MKFIELKELDSPSVIMTKEEKGFEWKSSDMMNNKRYNYEGTILF